MLYMETGKYERIGSSNFTEGNYFPRIFGFLSRNKAFLSLSLSRCLLSNCGPRIARCFLVARFPLIFLSENCIGHLQTMMKYVRASGTEKQRRTASIS